MSTETKAKQIAVTVERGSALAGIVETPNTAARDGKLMELGLAATKAVLEAGRKYFEVAEYVRKNQVPKVRTQESLRAVGFAESRISEIIKVAAAPAAIWQQYAERVIGWQKILSASRLLEMHTEPELFPGNAAPKAATAKAGKRARATAARRLERMAKAMCSICARNDTLVTAKQSKEFTFGDYRVTVTRQQVPARNTPKA